MFPTTFSNSSLFQQLRLLALLGHQFLPDLLKVLTFLILMSYLYLLVIWQLERLPGLPRLSSFKKLTGPLTSHGGPALLSTWRNLNLTERSTSRTSFQPRRALPNMCHRTHPRHNPSLETVRCKLLEKLEDVILLTLSTWTTTPNLVAFTCGMTFMINSHVFNYATQAPVSTLFRFYTVCLRL